MLIQDTLIDSLMEKSSVNIDVIKLLLEKGANFTEKSIDIICHEYNSPNLLSFFLLHAKKKITFSEKILTHVIRSNSETFKIIFYYDNTCFTNEHLILACQFGTVEMVKMFLKTGNYQITPELITKVSESQNIVMLRYLLQ